MSLAYFLCVLIGSGTNIYEAVLVNRTGQSILMDLRRAVFSHIQKMPMSTLDRYSSGRLITRATNDVEALNELFSDVLVNLFKDVFMLLGIVATMLIMNWRLALVAFTGVPLVFLVTFVIRGKLRETSWSSRPSSAASTAFLPKTFPACGWCRSSAARRRSCASSTR